MIQQGVDQWTALSAKSTELPRTELVYNIKEKPFMAALRYSQILYVIMVMILTSG